MIPAKKNKVKTSRRAAPVEELPVVKSEPPDEEPTAEVRDSQSTGVSQAVPAPATPDSSEDSSSEEEQQEAKPKATSDQLRSQKTATPAPIRPPVVSPVFRGLSLGFGKMLERVVRDLLIHQSIRVNLGERS